MKLENIKMDINTRLVLNVGYPMKSTNAPIAYNKLFSRRNMNALMLPVEIQRGDLKSLMEAVRTLNIRYLCMTMPHKGDMVNFVDDVDPSSRIFNSVNVVKIDDDGISHGVGMDGKGVVNALRAEHVTLAGANVMLIGAGSISGVIGLELSRCGVERITLLNRTTEHAKVIADKLNEHTKTRAQAMELTDENLNSCAAGADILIQATPLGMKGYGRDFTCLDFVEKLPDHGTVLDVVLNPAVTSLAKRARERGLHTIGGLQMLMGQMDAIFDYLFDETLEDEDKEACIGTLCEHLGIRNEHSTVQEDMT